MTTEEKEALNSLRHDTDRRLYLFIELITESVKNDGFNEYDVCLSVQDLRNFKEYFIDMLKPDNIKECER